MDTLRIAAAGGESTPRARNLLSTLSENDEFRAAYGLEDQDFTRGFSDTLGGIVGAWVPDDAELAWKRGAHSVIPAVIPGEDNFVTNLVEGSLVAAATNPGTVAPYVGFVAAADDYALGRINASDLVVEGLVEVVPGVAIHSANKAAAARQIAERLRNITPEQEAEFRNATGLDAEAARQVLSGQRPLSHYEQASFFGRMKRPNLDPELHPQYGRRDIEVGDGLFSTDPAAQAVIDSVPSRATRYRMYNIDISLTPRARTRRARPLSDPSLREPDTRDTRIDDTDSRVDDTTCLLYTSPSPRD